MAIEIDENQIIRRFKAISQFELAPQVTAAHLEQVRQTLIDLAGQQKAKRQNIWSRIMHTRLSKIAAAAVIILTISFFSWLGLRNDINGTTRSITGFSLLAEACAAEELLFTQGGIVQITNQIVVPPTRQAHTTGSAGRPDISESTLSYKWLPICSMQATGKFRFDQLQLPSDNDKAYTVKDQSWYDSQTGRFARVLKIGQKTFFANSYDGQFIYTSEIATDGTFRLVKTQTTEQFSPPQNPTQFLGLAAGMRSSFSKDNSPPIQEVTEGTLDDGSAVRIYTVGMADPQGKINAYWLFRIRHDDKTIAEMEFVIGEVSQLLIRRVRSQIVDAPGISWNLAELEGQVTEPGESPKVAVMANMVIPNVSVQHMVEKADYETYIFATDPPWAKQREITDVFDPGSPPDRMFIITYRAADGRHLVLVQSKTYNKMLSIKVKQCRLIHTSPDGFKLWSTPAEREKWLAGILLSSARASIKDPPAQDRTCFVLESPEGIFSALAINGQLSDKELAGLVDSLVPASNAL